MSKYLDKLESLSVNDLLGKILKYSNLEDVLDSQELEDNLEIIHDITNILVSKLIIKTI
jgi:hypothetical protein